MITINNKEELKEYYDEGTNTYVFDDDVTFNCNIDIESDIKAEYVKSWNIKVNDIDAHDIETFDMNANDINAIALYTLDLRANTITAKKISA